MIKNGFLFVELSIGLTLLTILIFIITHYIIEVKNVQQRTLLRMEALTIARNATEKVIAHAQVPTVYETSNSLFTINFEQQSSVHAIHKQKNNKCELSNATVSWCIDKKKYSLSLFLCVPKNDNNESDNGV